MIIIELAQGSYSRIEGTPLDQAIDHFTQVDADFLDKNPQCRPWHRPSWRQLEINGKQTAPWGYVWYKIDEDGRLQFHSAQYDSSD